jgi:peptidoglycan/LPS O-acetylase OafA/YrhL
VAAPGAAVERLHALDLLRFLAALLVVSFHIVPIIGVVYGVDVDATLGHPVAQLSRYGWLGPDFFFVISGFVICMSSWGRGLSQFVTSRATRLYPAYIVAVLVAAAIATFSPNPGFPAPPLVDVLVNLTMLQGIAGVPHLDSVYWTLLVELKFYLMFGLVVAFGVSYRRVVAFCAVWLLAGLVAEASETRFLVVLLEPHSTPFFIAGIALYLMYRFGASTLLWCLLAVGCIFSAKTLSEDLAGHVNPPISLNVVYALFAAFILVMIAVARGWTRWVRWRGLVTVGALTYPLYLLHFHVLFLTLRAAHGHLPLWLAAPLALAGVLALSYLVHRLVERPGSRALRRGLQRSFQQMRGRASA